jgi:hypothetical protein
MNQEICNRGEISIDALLASRNLIPRSVVKRLDP